MASALSEEQFQCCICLDFFRQPVSIPCGHNFCLPCIQQFWNTVKRSSCPLCKESFPHRPELRINHALADITDSFKKSLIVNPGQGRGQGKSQTERKEDEVVSPEVWPPRMLPVRRNLCGRHRQPVDFYCKMEKMLICSKCVDSQHQGHLTVHVERECEKMRAELHDVASKLQHMVQDRMEKDDEIKHAAHLSHTSMEKEIEQSLQIFTSLKRSVERSQTELVEELREKQTKLARNFSLLSEELEKEIADVVMKKSKVEDLACIDDKMHLLQSFNSVAALPQTRNWSQISCSTSQNVGTLRRAVEVLEEILRNQKKNLCEAELRQIQQHAVAVTFDPQTAAPWLIFSSDLKQASVSIGGYQPTTPISPSPLRFDSCVCVLGKPGISTGKHYWVIHVGDKMEWELGVAQESINRKGAIVVRPDKGFWAMCRQKGGHLVACAGPAITLFSHYEKPQKVGVFVDYEEGLVSFYDVEAQSHIYSYSGCTFAEKLYPYFNPCLHDDGKNTGPLIICPVGGGEVITSGLVREASRPPPLIRRQSSQAFLSQTTMF